MPSNGNCISAELDQFLSEPLISCQDDPASWWKMNMHRFPQLSPLTQKFLAPPPTSVPSERLFSNAAGDIISDHRCRLLPENVDSDLEVQQPPLGHVTFQLVVKCWSDSFDSFWLWFYFMLSIWTCVIKIYHLMLIIDNAKWLIWLTLALVLSYFELNSQIRLRFRLRPDLSSQIRPDPAPAGFGKVKSGTSLLINNYCAYCTCMMSLVYWYLWQMHTTCLPLDKRVLQHMKQLVHAGVRRVPEMRRHIRHFVEEQLFAGSTAPPVTDSRFWPSGKAVMNCIYRAVRQSRLVSCYHIHSMAHCTLSSACNTYYSVIQLYLILSRPLLFCILWNNGAGQHLHIYAPSHEFVPYRVWNARFSWLDCHWQCSKKLKICLYVSVHLWLKGVLTKLPPQTCTMHLIKVVNCSNGRLGIFSTTFRYNFCDVLSPL